MKHYWMIGIAALLLSAGSTSVMAGEAAGTSSATAAPAEAVDADSDNDSIPSDGATGDALNIRPGDPDRPVRSNLTPQEQAIQECQEKAKGPALTNCVGQAMIDHPG